jgi:hypothetical protein
VHGKTFRRFGTVFGRLGALFRPWKGQVKDWRRFWRNVPDVSFGALFWAVPGGGEGRGKSNLLVISIALGNFEFSPFACGASQYSGRSAAWLARFLGVEEVAGSSPAGPTILDYDHGRGLPEADESDPSGAFKSRRPDQASLRERGRQSLHGRSLLSRLSKFEQDARGLSLQSTFRFLGESRASHSF